jgi:hypothetical protein
MQVKLVCTGLVALARSRPTTFLEITLSGVRECPLGGRFSPLVRNAAETGSKFRASV